MLRPYRYLVEVTIDSESVHESGIVHLMDVEFWKDRDWLPSRGELAALSLKAARQRFPKGPIRIVGCRRKRWWQCWR